MKSLSTLGVLIILPLAPLACADDPMSSAGQPIRAHDLHLSLAVDPSSVATNSPLTVQLRIRNEGSELAVLEGHCGSPARFEFDRNGTPMAPSDRTGGCAVSARNLPIAPGDELWLIQEVRFRRTGAYRVRVVWSVRELDLPPLEQPFTVR